MKASCLTFFRQVAISPMLGTFPPQSKTDRIPWWLMVGIRLLLLAEGLGLWAIIIVLTIAYGFNILWLSIGGLVLLLGPALAFGIPALVVALRPATPSGSGRPVVFLLVNTVGAMVTGALAFSQPDPVWYYAVIAAASFGSTLLVLIAVFRLPVPIAACALGAMAILLGYAATYALPATAPPAPALHLEGVLSVPASAGSVTQVPGGEDVIFRLAAIRTDWRTGTVNPGTYRFSQACHGDWDHPTWATVQVPLGAVVRARDQCPPLGSARGHVTFEWCPGRLPVNCKDQAFTRVRVEFQDSVTGSHEDTTTDDSGNYTIQLPPGTYTVLDVPGYVLAAGQRVVTVESATTVRVDLTLRVT